MTDYEDAKLIPPANVADMVLNADEVLRKAWDNSSHSLTRGNFRVDGAAKPGAGKICQGHPDEAECRGGLQSHQADGFAAAYSHLKDNEIIGLTVTLPIFDWGVQKGKVMVAKSNLELAKTKKEQADQDYVQKIKRDILQFSFQSEQCRTSMRAQEISNERYEITKKRCRDGQYIRYGTQYCHPRTNRDRQVAIY